MDEAAAYMQIEGVADRNAAELLRGKLIYIDRAHAVQLPEETEFICDLIGCHGHDETGRDLLPGVNFIGSFMFPLFVLLSGSCFRRCFKGAVRVFAEGGSRGGAVCFFPRRGSRGGTLCVFAERGSCG